MCIRDRTNGSGGPDARTTIKLGYRDGLSRDDALELAVLALYEAADADSGTGGPDIIRGIYPIVSTVTAEGYVQLESNEVADRFSAVIERRRELTGDAGGSLR